MYCVNHPEIDQGILRCLRCQRAFCPDCVVMLRGYWYCAGCKIEQVRDIQSGTTVALELAGIGRRLVATLIDGFVVGIGMLLILLPFLFVIVGSAAGVGMASPGSRQTAETVSMLATLAAYPVMLALQVGIPLVYEALMLTRSGQTLGKMALSLKVVTPEGTDITRGQAWGRTGLKVVLSTMCSCFGLLADDLPAFFTAEKTALHDMAAKTRVVRLR